MTYNPAIPQATDLLSVSQGDLLNNFSALNTIFDKDHFTWNNATAANRGLHRQVTFPVVLVADPIVLTTIGVIYTKAISALGEVFYANSAGPSVMWRGGTASGLVTQTTGAALSNGKMLLPNGIMLQWGSAGPFGDNTTITFPTAFATACFQVQLTILRNNNDVRSMYLNAAPTTTNFVARTSASSISCVWFAIGN